MSDLVQRPGSENWEQSVFQWISRRTGITTQTTTYTVAENIFYVRCNVTSAGFTVTLPLAKGRDGRQIVVKKIDASGNTLTVGISGSDTIQGSATVTTTTQWASWIFISNGNNAWELL